MGKIFVTGCTHFGHENILKFEAENRPFKTIGEHDAAIIDKWNSTVGVNDTVYHLGDVAFPRLALQQVSLLNGKKKLILGNHDRHPIGAYHAEFDEIMGCARIKDVLLSHYPVNPMCLEHREKFNIHCHIHSKVIPGFRYLNASVEHWDLTPIEFDRAYSLLFEGKPE